MAVTRGEVWQADLSPTRGTEQSGVRPVLVVQTDRANPHSPHTIIIPFTTRVHVRFLGERATVTPLSYPTRRTPVEGYYLLLLWPLSGLMGTAVGVIQTICRGGKKPSALIGQILFGSIFGILFGPFVFVVIISDLTSFRDKEGKQSASPPPEITTKVERYLADEKCALCGGIIPNGQSIMVEIKSETQTSHQAFHPECARVYQSTSPWPKLWFYCMTLLLPILIFIIISIMRYWPK